MEYRAHGAGTCYPAGGSSTPAALAITITFSDVGSTTLPLVPPPGPGNLNEDPIFVSSTLLNFLLQVGSNCIDAGNDLLIAFDVLDIDNDTNFGELTPIDLGEGPRQLDNNLTTDTGIPDGGGDGIVDMGVFETPIDAQ